MGSKSSKQCELQIAQAIKSIFVMSMGGVNDRNQYLYSTLQQAREVVFYTVRCLYLGKGYEINFFAKLSHDEETVIAATDTCYLTTAIIEALGFTDHEETLRVRAAVEQQWMKQAHTAYADSRGSSHRVIPDIAPAELIAAANKIERARKSFHQPKELIA